MVSTFTYSICARIYGCSTKVYENIILKLNLSEKLWIYTSRWWNRNICMNEVWRGLECRERGNEFSFLEASKPSVTCLSVPACPNAAYATGITFPHIYDTSLFQQQQRKVGIEKVVSYPAKWSLSFILGPLHWSSIFPTSREQRNIVQLYTNFESAKAHTKTRCTRKSRRKAERSILRRTYNNRLLELDMNICTV